MRDKCEAILNFTSMGAIYIDCLLCCSVLWFAKFLAVESKAKGFSRIMSTFFVVDHHARILSNSITMNTCKANYFGILFVILAF